MEDLEPQQNMTSQQRAANRNQHFRRFILTDDAGNVRNQGLGKTKIHVFMNIKIIKNLIIWSVLRL